MPLEPIWRASEITKLTPWSPQYEDLLASREAAEAAAEEEKNSLSCMFICCYLETPCFDCGDHYFIGLISSDVRGFLRFVFPMIFPCIDCLELPRTSINCTVCMYLFYVPQA